MDIWWRKSKALEEILNLPSSYFTSLIAFVGDCEFKTPMPENVFSGLSYTKYIKSFYKYRLTPVQVRTVINKLQRARLEQGFSTNRNHVDNLKERKKTTTTYSSKKTCSQCNNAMIIRNNRNTGEEFYGCSSYPRCKNTMKIS